MIDWGLAGTIAGAGIGMVAIVLVMLAVATWLMGVLIRKMESRHRAKEEKQQRAQS